MMKVVLGGKYTEWADGYRHFKQGLSILVPVSNWFREGWEAARVDTEKEAAAFDRRQALIEAATRARGTQCSDTTMSSPSLKT